LDRIIFVPLAPTPTVGSVIVANKDQFQKLDASLASVFNSLTLWGIGSGEWINEEGRKEDRLKEEA
jgi:uncharacterized membrane protein